MAEGKSDEIKRLFDEFSVAVGKYMIMARDLITTSKESTDELNWKLREMRQDLGLEEDINRPDKPPLKKDIESLIAELDSPEKEQLEQEWKKLWGFWSWGPEGSKFQEGEASKISSWVYPSVREDMRKNGKKMELAYPDEWKADEAAWRLTEPKLKKLYDSFKGPRHPDYVPRDIVKTSNEFQDYLKGILGVDAYQATRSENVNEVALDYFNKIRDWNDELGVSKLGELMKLEHQRQTEIDMNNLKRANPEAFKAIFNPERGMNR